MTTNTRGTNPALWKEPPLPGMAQCVTLQLNATYYRQGTSCRWVAILRDPDANLELGRLIGVLRQDDADAAQALFDDLGSMLNLVDYQLHGTVDDLKQALADEPPPPGGVPSAHQVPQSSTVTSGERGPPREGSGGAS